MQPFSHSVLAAFILFTVVRSSAGAATVAEATEQLAGALLAKDQSRVETCAKVFIEALGSKAGQATEAPEFMLPDEDAKVLEAEQVAGLFDRALSAGQADAWWKSNPPRPEAPAPLRVVASFLEGCLAAREARSGPAADLLKEAVSAGDFLLAVQKLGGKENFPFPAWKGKRGRYGMIADRLLRDAEAAGKASDAIQSGWIISDQGSGELNLDNSLAGQALLSLYEAAKQDAYLEGARAAAKWAEKHPVVPTAHLNSHSVTLLARLAEITGEKAHLDAALEICRLGILPTQIKEGPNAGRWASPADAKMVYHFQNLRALTILLLAVPQDSPDHPALEQALRLGLKAHNQTIITQGGTSLDVTLEVYCLLLEHQENLSALLTDTLTFDAASMIFRAAVEEYRLEHPTISPGTWGHFLKFTAGKGK